MDKKICEYCGEPIPADQPRQKKTCRECIDPQRLAKHDAWKQRNYSYTPERPLRLSQ